MIFELDILRLLMTTNDQKVVKSGQTQGFIEQWTSDPSIDGKLLHKLICVIFEYDILRLFMTTHDQKVVKSGWTQSFIKKWTSGPSIDGKLPDKFIHVILNTISCVYWWPLMTDVADLTIVTISGKPEARPIKTGIRNSFFELKSVLD